MRTRGNRAAPRNTKKDETAVKKTLTDLLNIMARLRGPSGCPWDKEQTAQTLKRYLIEETYETLEAIETGTPEALKEELGDLLLQIIFLSRISEEGEEFRFSDVVHTLAEKLIRRHPHVFPSADGLAPSPKTTRMSSTFGGPSRRWRGSTLTEPPCWRISLSPFQRLNVPRESRNGFHAWGLMDLPSALYGKNFRRNWLNSSALPDSLRERPPKKRNSEICFSHW